MSKAVSGIRMPGREAPAIVRAEELFDQTNRLSEEIARRAYELFDQRGRAQGLDLSDWLQAESELLQPVPIEIVETADKIKVRAEVPGFTADELQLSVEPLWVVIAGRMDLKPGKSGEATHSELRSKRICKVIDLPVEVQTTRAEFELKDDVLELALPIAFKSLRSEALTA
jgi:HSP20 family protein